MAFFSYCASSMDMLVPRGQLSDTRSESHVVFWNVCKVPDSNAIFKKVEKRNKQELLIISAVSFIMLFTS